MMTFRNLKTCLAAFLLVFGACVTAAAQGRAILRGSVNDEVGAVIVGATVTLTDASGAQKTATTGNDGAFTFTGLTPGKYLLRAEAGGFAQSDDINVDVTTARRDPTVITLKVAEIQSEVKVESTPPISTDPASNANQQVLTGKDIEALPDDPDELAAALQALAGPQIGPGGGQIFIDGFSGANLPPRESIREIRINQNPFAAENDQPSGRIDILTKPGTDKFRGSLNGSFTDESLNSRNPFAVSSSKRSPYQVRQYGGSFSGPLIKNKASFFVDANRNETDDNELIRATVLGPGFTVQQFGVGFLRPVRSFNISPRLEYAINPRNTFIARYSFNRNRTENNGVGGFSLPERGYDFQSTNQNIQLTETAVINATTINETRFQFARNTNESFGTNTIPTLNVSGAFNGCAVTATNCSSVGHAINERSSWELNNFTQIQHGVHNIKFGGRLRGVHIDDTSPANFGGNWTFTGGFGPQLDAGNNPITGTNVLLSSIERYRRSNAIAAQGALTAQQQAYCGAGATVAQCIRSLGGGASQFSINAGNPNATVSQIDAGFYLQDDWRMRPNLTFSYGLRYEYQTNINSKFNFAPRIAFAWSPGAGANATKPPKMVIRGGVGLFYNRFGEGQTLQSRRFNGSNELQYVITDPAVILGRPPTLAEQTASPSFTFLNQFPGVPTSAQLATVPATQQTIWRVADNLQAPEFYLTGLQVERQLPKNFTMVVGAFSLRILHAIRARDINAPLAPTFTTRPQPTLGDIYQYESSGKFRQNQMIVQLNSRLNPRISLSAGYFLSKTTNDTDGQGGSLFPMNSYDLTGEYGRAAFDVRHRFTLFGTYSSPWWKLTFNPFIIVNSGPPFNITTGQDLNLDRQFNERPTFAQLNTFCTALPTRCTSFDYSNTSNQFIPRNYGNGPGFWRVDMTVSRTFTWGGEAARASNSQRGGGNNARGGGAGGRGSTSGPQLGNVARAAGGGGESGGGGRGPGGGGPGPGGLGGGGGGGAGKYSLNVSINAQNLFNHVNYSTPVGVLTSTNFGQSLGLAGGFGGPFGGGFGGSSGAGNRRIYLRLRFTF
ncbi:MAG TPA: carboxypeptidase regulatory-like domain-containing protein [Pyrinomonadaceae bacterium]|nr:carboxypeptidase regulatory-like domain-containing protein [Pyrinomonadaceae bacterium]